MITCFECFVFMHIIQGETALETKLSISIFCALSQNYQHILEKLNSGNSLTRSSWGLAFYYLLSELCVIQQIYYVMNVLGIWQNTTCYQEFLVNRVSVNELLLCKNSKLIKVSEKLKTGNKISVGQTVFDQSAKLCFDQKLENRLAHWNFNAIFEFLRQFASGWDSAQNMLHFALSCSFPLTLPRPIQCCVAVGKIQCGQYRRLVRRQSPVSH